MFDPTAVSYIDTHEKLQSALEPIQANATIALDTEADSLHHYFEKVCLIQVSVPGADYLVDPLAGLDLSALLDVLSSKELIIQGADYDLRMMRRDYQFTASRIFDTMSAAQILGYDKFSYAALVERHAGIVLSKHGQKADWSQRPLPEKLVQYAAADTFYLFEVAEKLKNELTETGRTSWHEEICCRLLDYVSEGSKQPDPEKQWRIKGWHQLKPGRGWAYLREVWNWRDEESQRLDFPPFKIMRNETLIEIALWAQDGYQPAKTPKFPKNIVGRRRRNLEEALANVKRMPEMDWPKPLGQTKRDFRAPDEPLLTEMKRIRDSHAVRLKLDPGILLPAAALTALALAKPDDQEKLRASGNLYHWQAAEMGDELLAAINKTKPSGANSNGLTKVAILASNPSTLSE